MGCEKRMGPPKNYKNKIFHEMTTISVLDHNNNNNNNNENNDELCSIYASK